MTDIAALESRYAADIVEILNQQRLERATAVLAAFRLELAVEVLEEPELERAGDLIQHLPTDRVLALLQSISTDRAADILRQVPDPARSRLLKVLDPETASSLEQLLGYPADTAGSLMTTEFLGVPSTWTVEATLQHIREVESTRETVYAIYILDPTAKTLLRTASLRQLITGKPSDSILSLAPDQTPVVATPLMDREEVARLIKI